MIHFKKSIWIRHFIKMYERLFGNTGKLKNKISTFSNVSGKNIFIAEQILESISPIKSIFILAEDFDKSVFKFNKNIIVSNNISDLILGKFDFVFVIEDNFSLRYDAITKCIQLFESAVHDFFILTSAIKIKINDDFKIIYKPEINNLDIPLVNPLTGFFAMRGDLISLMDMSNFDLYKYSNFHFMCTAIYKISSKIEVKSLSQALCHCSDIKSNIVDAYGLLFYKKSEVRIFEDVIQSKNVFFKEYQNLSMLTPMQDLANLNPAIVVFIPFKNNFELTIICIDSVRKNLGSAKIVAINNKSNESPYLKYISSICDEFIDVDYPFNYSFIHNFAISKSKIAKLADYFLFLNNDVILMDKHISKLINWFSLKDVAAVGCKLLYPNGKIQFGGVGFSRNKSHDHHNWFHIDQHKNAKDSTLANFSYFAHSLTCACALVRREVFDMVGGFNPISAPIGFSDADLFLKIRKLGFLLVYDGSIFAVHHESVSRGIGYDDSLEAQLAGSHLSNMFSNLTIEVI